MLSNPYFNLWCNDPFKVKISFSVQWLFIGLEKNKRIIQTNEWCNSCFRSPIDTVRSCIHNFLDENINSCNIFLMTLSLTKTNSNGKVFSVALQTAWFTECDVSTHFFENTLIYSALAGDWDFLFAKDDAAGLLSVSLSFNFSFNFSWRSCIHELKVFMIIPSIS